MAEEEEALVADVGEEDAPAPAEAPAPPAGDGGEDQPAAEKKSEGLTEDTIKFLGENRKKIQDLNNTIKDLRCQEIFTYKNQRQVDLTTDDMLLKMKMANCDFLRNFNNMWGITQNLLEGLDVERIASRELSYVPSSTVALGASKVTRSESFEKLSSKRLPRVIVCGTDTSEMVPRIIVCEDKDTVVPPGDCNTIQSNRNVASSSFLAPSGYTSYGGRFC